MLAYEGGRILFFTRQDQVRRGRCSDGHRVLAKAGLLTSSRALFGVCRGVFLRVFFLMLCVQLGAHAAGPDCSRSYTLALHDHGLLYSPATDSGIDKDFADELIRRSTCQVRVSLMSRARIWQLIETGALDFSLSGIATPERRRFASFAWYFSNKYYLLMRKDAGISKIADVERHENFKLGVVRSFRYSASANTLVDKLLATNRVSQAGGLDPLYQALLANSIQGLIMEPFDFNIAETRRLFDIASVIEFNDPPVPHGLIMSNKSLQQSEREQWRSIVQDMRADGTILRIFQKYLSPQLAAAMVQFQAEP